MHLKVFDVMCILRHNLHALEFVHIAYKSYKVVHVSSKRMRLPVHFLTNPVHSWREMAVMGWLWRWLGWRYYEAVIIFL